MQLEERRATLLIRGLLHCRRAQDTVEYVLLITLIALAITAGAVTFADSLMNVYGQAAECVPIPGQGPPEGVPGEGPPECKGGR